MTDSARPASSSSSPTHELRCCCGRSTCAFLAHNYHIVQDLERDVHEAGRAGQQLLERHERYIHESDTQRKSLLGAMEELEKNKEALEASNARIIDENRSLLDQLEEMNSAVTESDLHISSLKGTLENTQSELKRLNGLAHKATQLEMELTTLESERAKFDAELATNQQDRKSAVVRWRKAESMIGSLQEQIEGMEREAREERERHQEVLARVERQKTVNLHLSTTATKGAARASGATHTAGEDGVSGGVVTHFVKDILQDNSNLQLGILELKELLLASNSEVSNLRSQLELHQPVAEVESPAQTLDAEMKAGGPNESALESVPEYHVHHHYHQQKILPRKPRKRRPAFPSGNVPRLPTSMALDGHQRQASRGYTSAAAAILSNTSVSVPTGHRSRWSMQSVATESSYAPSSLSTSPRHPSSVFDSFDAAFDSTQATTPMSSAPGSPLLQAMADKLPNMNHDSNNSDISPLSPFPPHQQHFRQPSYLGDATILEEEDPNTPNRCSDIDSSTETESVKLTPKPSQQRLRRIMSHESILSLSGMDIHAPSRSLGSSSFDNKNPLALISSDLSASAYSNPKVTSDITVSANLNNPFTSASSSSSSTSGGELARLLLSQRSSHQNLNLQNTEEGKSLGKRVGGWVFGKWGAAPTSHASVGDLRARTVSGGAMPSAKAEDADPTAAHPMFRNPGINQSGPIFGLPKPKRTPSNVRPVEVDIGLLEESMEQSP